MAAVAAGLTLMGESTLVACTFTGNVAVGKSGGGGAWFTGDSHTDGLYLHGQ